MRNKGAREDVRWYITEYAVRVTEWDDRVEEGMLRFIGGPLQKKSGQNSNLSPLTSDNDDVDDDGGGGNNDEPKLVTFVKHYMSISQYSMFDQGIPLSLPRLSSASIATFLDYTR